MTGENIIIIKNSGANHAIEFIKDQINKYGNIENLYKQKKEIINVINSVFVNYRKDIIEWLKNNYFNDEIEGFLNELDIDYEELNIASTEQDNSSLYKATEISDAKFDRLMGQEYFAESSSSDSE